jgi:drug/metabolite transporter (DMT)-like permease
MSAPEVDELPIGPRAAIIPIQLLALVLGILDGSLLFLTVVGVLVVLKILPESLELIAAFICIAFCAYYFAAPATWRGLWRRVFQILAVSLLGFAALGYVFAFAGLPVVGLPNYDLLLQLGVVVVGVAAVLASILLGQGERQGERQGEPNVGSTRSADASPAEISPSATLPETPG